jgi:outer membrane protein assembly factor BamB
MHGIKTLLAFAFILAIPATRAADDNWPQFRGPTADGHSSARGLPLTWAEGKNIVWKTAIHDMGWSSPVIWGKQIWMTSGLGSVEKQGPDDGKQLFVICVDKDTGKILYDFKAFDVEKPGTRLFYNSFASPTPVIEEGRVYLHFGSPGTCCVDTATGKVLWSRNDLPCDHWRAAGSSPILFENLLILTFDGYDVQYLAALDKTTGKTVWKTDRNITTYKDNKNGDIKKAYSTPAVVMVDGQPQLISPSAQCTMGYNPRTGEELWRVQHGGMNAASLPVYGFGKVFVTTAAGGEQLVAIRPEMRNPAPANRIDWSFKKNVPSRPSPLLVGDLLFMVSDAGLVSCVDAKTGELVNTLRLKGKFSASPIYAEGRIYFVSEDGPTTVVAANRELKELAVNALDGSCMASPAASGKALYLRTKTHLYRIEEK